jgi:hypothetical protein
LDEVVGEECLGCLEEIFDEVDFGVDWVFILFFMFVYF